MQYFQTSNKTLKEFSDKDITGMYDQGYVFTRIQRGNLLQTKSLRINLAKFELTSENRRILKKNDQLTVEITPLPLSNYRWEIHSLGKEFYTKKFGDGTMSASKIKEMFKNPELNNMTHALIYIQNSQKIGYCLAYINNEIIHYAYPFYDLNISREQSLGLGMMLKAITWSKDQNKKYIYLGSVTDRKAHYKLQFKGLEWWDSSINTWSEDLESLKLLTNI